VPFALCVEGDGSGVSDRLDCPDCGGSGEQRMGPLVLACNFCGGRGYVGDDSGPPPEPPPVWADVGTANFPGCRVCLGAGHVVTSTLQQLPCPACSGDSAT